MPSLFHLSQNIAGLEAALDNEQDPEALNQLTLELLSTEDDLQRKVESYCGFIGELEALADARQDEIDRLIELKNSAACKADRLRDALRMAMLRTGRTKMVTTRYAVRTQKAGGKPPLEFNDLPVPPRWTTHKLVVSPDKERIRAALEEGELLDFARLGERKDLLVIK